MRTLTILTATLAALTLTAATASTLPDEEQLMAARPDNAEFCSKTLSLQPGTQAFVNCLRNLAGSNVTQTESQKSAQQAEAKENEEEMIDEQCTLLGYIETSEDHLRCMKNLSESGYTKRWKTPFPKPEHRTNTVQYPNYTETRNGCWMDYCPCDTSDPDYGGIDISLCRDLKGGLEVDVRMMSLGAKGRDFRREMRKLGY